MNKETILSIKGGEFKEWYSSLDEASKLTYRQVRREMDGNLGNNFAINPAINPALVLYTLLLNPPAVLLNPAKSC